MGGCIQCDIPFSYASVFCTVRNGTCCIKKTEFGKRGVKSCLNLLILYLFWQVIYNTLRGVFSSIVNKEAADNLIYELIFPSTLYWYLSALLVYYIVFYLLINRCNKKGLAVVCIIAFIISSFIPFLQEMLKLNGFIYKLLYHFFYFIFGYIVLGHKEKFFEKLGKLFFMPGLSIIFIALFIIFDSITQTIPFIKVIFTMAIILGLLFLVIKLKKLQINQIAAYLGRNSIYIYIIHNYITVALRTLYAKSGSNFPSVIYFVLCLIITLTLCTAVQQIAKRLWLLDIFFKPIKVLDKICCKEKIHTDQTT